MKVLFEGETEREWEEQFSERVRHNFPQPYLV